MTTRSFAYLFGLAMLVAGLSFFAIGDVAEAKQRSGGGSSSAGSGQSGKSQSTAKPTQTKKSTVKINSGGVNPTTISRDRAY